MTRVTSYISPFLTPAKCLDLQDMKGTSRSNSASILSPISSSNSKEKHTPWTSFFFLLPLPYPRPRPLQALVFLSLLSLTSCRFYCLFSSTYCAIRFVAHPLHSNALRFEAWLPPSVFLLSRRGYSNGQLYMFLASSFLHAPSFV